MPSQRFGRSIRTLALSLLISAAPLAAQTMTPGGVLPAGAPQTTNADLLSRYLRELAGDPENLDALKGAGNAALEIGDTDAALALFTRAEKVAPRDGEVKAGIARALLKAENPRDALRMFDDAVRLGVPEAKIAGDRGLAYDLRGEPRRAQRDYQIALAARPDDEITRRYALSLAISGDREQALKQLQPQIYRRDAAAWRAQAFVLAMTGDPREAGKITHAMMPDPMADAMQPFLVRLAGLKPTEKALAVHLGRFPSDGTRMASNRRDETPAPTPAPAPAQLAAVTPPPPASRPT
ncbi:MAG: SPOR domain-containing protein, partial [Sphingomonas sanxanigenens]